MKPRLKVISFVMCCLMLMVAFLGCSSSAQQTEEASASQTVSTEATAAETSAEASMEASPTETLNWIAAGTLAEDTPMSQAMIAFAQAFKEATNGRVNIEFYANMALGSETEQFEMCRANTVALVGGSLSTLSIYDEEMTVYTFPYIFRTWEDCKSYLTESDYGLELWDRFEQNFGLKCITIQRNGQRDLQTKDLIVQSTADLKGVEIRCMDAQIWKDVFSAWGATPVPIAFSELYVALQTGVVQGNDNPIGVTYAQKLYEVQNNIYKTEHNFNTTFWMINSECWNMLTEDEQATFMELEDEYLQDYYYELFDNYEEEAEQFIEDYGVRIWEQDEFDIQSFIDASDAMINEKYMVEPYTTLINDIRDYCGYN